MIQKSMFGITFNLTLAILTALALVLMNETNYQSSKIAAETIEISNQTGTAIEHLLLNVLDAETGQRGYLLTRL